MKKILAVLLGILTVVSLTITASAEVPAAAYPASGTAIPDGSVCIKGELIGNETGWGGSETAGRAAAFDGDVTTFFDPLGVGDGFCGMDAGKPYILTKVAIHPRDAQLARFYGATIQGSNDGEEWTDIWMSLDEATEWTWQEVEADEFDESGVAYRYYRYYNMLSHGDVAEVEFYGYPEDGVVEEAPAETEAETVAETEAPAAEAETEAPETEAETEAAEETVETSAETTAPQTFDMGVIAAALAAVSAAGYAVSKKRR